MNSKVVHAVSDLNLETEVHMAEALALETSQVRITSGIKAAVQSWLLAEFSCFSVQEDANNDESNGATFSQDGNNCCRKSENDQDGICTGDEAPVDLDSQTSESIDLF